MEKCDTLEYILEHLPTNAEMREIERDEREYRRTHQDEYLTDGQISALSNLA